MHTSFDKKHTDMERYKFYVHRRCACEQTAWTLVVGVKFRTQTFITKTSFQKHYNDNVREIVVMATSRMFTFAMQYVKVCSSVTVARYEHTVICNLVYCRYWCEEPYISQDVHKLLLLFACNTYGDILN